MPKRIILTGATRGCGLALARFFMKEGHTVLACGSNQGRADAVQNDFPAPNRLSVVDVSHDTAVAAWAKECLTAHGAPDLVLNNAALINRTAPLWEVPAGEFDRVIDVNIKGTANVIRHFLPAMIAAKKGVIVNFSSGWGRSTSPEVAPYCATKYAVEGLTHALAQELPGGMAAVPLNPGIIDTEMLRSCWSDAAGAYPDPETWVKAAGPFILKLGPKDNGRSLSVPGS
jgi:NAD(P)-dependent dehydrogenase (short-subunit alcohol dehydrogenase family)